ncbi:unnamed protein product [Rhizophagus irregularis]|nr:unnamed protein product [Rhizophagus irregularis]
MEPFSQKIDPDIPIPKDTNSFDLLISVLKDHVTHSVFRADSLEKLNKLKCERNREMSEFIAKFTFLCRGANITDWEEKKRYLLRNLPDDIVRNVFRSRIENLNSSDKNSFDKVIETFRDVMLEHRRQIRYGSKIALKHVATGRFLSSKDIRYDTGSNQHIVFCGNWQPDRQTDFWIVIPPHAQNRKAGNPVAFNSLIGLKHQQTSRNLHSHDGIESRKQSNKRSLVVRAIAMTTGYYNVIASIAIITIRDIGRLVTQLDGNQEVTCHADGHEENHKWIVEFFE